MSATEQKHTPGPWWTTDSGVRDVGGYICHTNQPTHFQGQDERYDREVDERKANKALIAAAPELLDALIWMVANDETNEGDEPVESLDGESWNDCNKYWIDGLNRARAAIAKATGATHE